MSELKTLNQERANFALKKIQIIKEEVKSEEKKNKFASNAKRLPALITTNGLIPALAFLKSKDETRPVYDTINDWLKQKGFSKDNKDVLEYLLDCNFSTLRLATMEALSFANWLKRMVEIEIKEKNNE
jgi:CRISPR-associated protein Cmr5